MWITRFAIILGWDIWNVLKSLKNGRAAGEDNIPAEALKEGGETIVDQFHKLLNLGEIPSDWKKGIFVKLLKKTETSRSMASGDESLYCDFQIKLSE